MSRTAKDRPWHLGGQRHKWHICANHGAHGKFATAMRRARRRQERRELRKTGDPHRKSRWRYYWFD